MQSEQINELAAALAKAQAEMRGADKNAKANYGKYADLNEIWATIREPLTNHGLSVVQATKRDEKGIVLVSTLLHSSGQWMKSETPLVDTGKGGPHGFGAAMTYTRRYSLSALVGVTLDEDDDGTRIQKEYEQKTAKPEFLTKQEIDKVNSYFGPDDGEYHADLLMYYSNKLQCSLTGFEQLPRDALPSLLTALERRKEKKSKE